MRHASIAVLFMLSAMVCFSLKASFAEIDAAKLFKTHCVVCHGEDGKGSDLGQGLGAPDFTDQAWSAKTSDDKIIHQIENGTEGKMFPFKDKLSPDEIKAMIPFLRQFSAK